MQANGWTKAEATLGEHGREVCMRLALLQEINYTISNGFAAGIPQKSQVPLSNASTGAKSAGRCVNKSQWVLACWVQDWPAQVSCHGNGRWTLPI